MRRRLIPPPHLSSQYHVWVEPFRFPSSWHSILLLLIRPKPRPHHMNRFLSSSSTTTTPPQQQIQPLRPPQYHRRSRHSDFYTGSRYHHSSSSSLYRSIHRDSLYHRSYSNNNKHHHHPKCFGSTFSATTFSTTSDHANNDTNTNTNNAVDDITHHHSQHSMDDPRSTTTPQHHHHPAFQNRNDDMDHNTDVNEIDTNDNDTIIDILPPPTQQQQPPPSSSLHSTTSSAIRPKATSRIEFDQEDSYYNDYCKILDQQDDIDEGDYVPPPSSSSSSERATNTMATVSAIAHGTYASSNYYYENLTLNSNPNSNHKSNPLPQINTPPQPRRKYNVYDLDAAIIKEINNIEDIADIVTQVENVPTIHGSDVEPLIIPLSRITSMKRYGEYGAKLTERLLLTCLGRLPITIFDRYTKQVTYVESTMPNKFSTVLDTNDWLPTITTSALVLPPVASTNALTNGTRDASIGTTSDTTSMTTVTPATQNFLKNTMAPIRIRSKLSYPTATLYNRAIIAWGNLANGAGLMRAESMFQLQIEEYVRELEFVRYHQMKNRQQEIKNQRNPSSNTLPYQGLNPELQLPPEPFAPPPGRKAYKSLIRAWAVSGEKNAAAKSYELLREMEHLSGVQELLQQPRDTSLRPLPPIPPIEMPDIATYNVVLSVYAKSPVLQHPVVLERVKKIVRRIRDLHDATNNDEYSLDAYSYIALLQSYQKYLSSCTPPLDYVYLDEIYTAIRDIHSEIERRKHLPPDNQKGVYAMKRDMDDHKVPQKKQKDLSIFFPMSMSWAYGVLVEALLKSSPLYRTIFIADDIVTAIAGRKNRINTAPSLNDPTNVNHVATSVPIYIPYEICANLWPQYETLMQVVEGWSRCGLPQANDRIEQLIQLVVADAHYPRIFNLHDAMESWANSAWQFAPYIVENLLQRALEKATHVQNKPTGQTFAIAIKAWMKSNKAEAPHRAELLLQHLLFLYEVQEDSWYKPREVHLRYVITNWLNRCKTGELYDGMNGKNLYPAEHCEKIIYWIRNRTWFQPIAEMVYGMAIRAWAIQKLPDTEKDVSIFDLDNDNATKRSSSKLRTLPQPNPVAHALQLLNSFVELKISTGDFLPPYPCNWVLETCCRIQPTMELKVEAYDTAIRTFQRCKHNARTYELMVQVIRIQVETLDDTHRSLIEELFRQCCVEGLVSQDMIVHVVSTARSPETIQRLFGLSYQIAQLILQQREVHMSSYSTGKHAAPQSYINRYSLKNYDRLPALLQISNLPKEWSTNVGGGKKSKNNNISETSS